MSNNLFKPNRPGSDQDKQQVPQQAPAAPAISMELLDKIAELLKGIETMNGKIADNYDVIAEMRESLKKLRDQLQNIKAPEARLDDESRKIISSASNTITSGINNFNTAVNNAQDTFKKNIEGSANHLSEPLNKLVDELTTSFKTKIGKFVEEKAKKATSNITLSIVENWIWRVLAITGLFAFCLAWLYPKIEEIDFPGGVEGFLGGVVIMWITAFAVVGIYKWGKANGSRW